MCRIRIRASVWTNRRLTRDQFANWKLMAPTVSRNKVVYLTYTIIDQAGNLFEQYDMPTGYVHGANGPLFEKIEQALEGRQVGDRVEVILSPAHGFGDVKPELTFTDDIADVPPEHRHLGSEVTFQNDRGEEMLFRVTRIENGKLTVEANHPLAGQAVKFVVSIVPVRPANLDEIANGMPQDSGGNTPRPH